MARTTAPAAETTPEEVTPEQGEAAPTPRPAATDELVREIRYLLRARNHLLWVVSPEERRAERIIAAAAALEKYKVRFWDCATGARDLEGKKIDLSAGGNPEVLPSSVFDKIRAGLDAARLTPNEFAGLPDNMKSSYIRVEAPAGEYYTRPGERALWVLRDLHDWTAQDPVVVRGLKSLTRDLQDVTDKSRLVVIVVLSSQDAVPVNLENSAVRWDWPLPKREEVGEILDDVLAASKRTINGEREAVIDAALGLTADDMSAAFARSIVRHKRVDPVVVAIEKKRAIDRQRGLTWYQADQRGMDAIGGLGLLKQWLMERRVAFTPEAKQYGLQAPRGIVLVGPPGTGKSTVAKSVATCWRMPLIQVDMGAMKGSLVGESERHIRSAFRTLSAVAPIVGWLDEAEKALRGSQGSGDSGVSADQLGYILTWMQEHEEPVPLIVTINNPDGIPPELFSRFDEVFFVDLPNMGERLEILDVSLRKRVPGYEDGMLGDLSELLSHTDGFSGRELDKLVSAAMFSAFPHVLRASHLVSVAEKSKNSIVSRSNREKVDFIRTWAQERARPASEKSAIARPMGGFGRSLEIDPADLEEDEIQ